MAKNGSTSKADIEDELALEFGRGNKMRTRRDASPTQKQYLASLKKINQVLDRAINEAENDPEYGVSISRQCTQFVMKTMPSPKQDPKRAIMLDQYDMLEMRLAAVRKPDEFLTRKKEQFGKDLDHKNYQTDSDSFSTIISSQKERVRKESLGFNTQLEENFCERRRELLTVVEKGYNKLRDQALGIPSNDKEKGRGR